MDLTIVNLTNELKWEEYENSFLSILNQTKKVLSLSDDFSCSLILVDSEKIQEINFEYRNLNQPTDVISFALHDSDDQVKNEEIEQELGDIFINVDAVVTQAKEYGHSEHREITFLFTHGLLHLLRYDHLTREDETEMFRLQEVILDELVPREVD